MTAPYTPQGPRYSRQQLHGVAQLAMQDLERDPNNAEAREALMGALDGIRSWAQVEGPQQARDGAIRDTQEATNPGALRSGVLGFGQGASFGFADELAGVASAIPRMIPGGQSPGAAYARGRDEHRAMSTAGGAFNPVVTGLSDIAGGVAGGTAAVRGAIGLAPAIGRTLTAGATAGASMGQKLLAALTGGGIGAVAGGTDAYGRGEQGASEDLQRVPMGATLGGALGAAGTYVGSAMNRASQVRAAKELKAVNEGAASTLDLQRQQAQVAADEARARMLGIRASEAEAVAPARIQSAQNQAALSTERLQAQPTIRQRQAAAADRAQGSAERAGAREADRLLDLPLNRQMQQDRATILAFRASRLGKLQGPGVGSSEQRLRQWAQQQGMDEAGIERALKAHRAMQMPGSGVAREAVPEPSVARPVSPETIQRTVVDPEAVVAAVPESGTIAPNMGTMPGSPREAARAAYNLTEAAGGDATEAASRAAGFAQGAVPEVSVPGLDDVAGSLGDAFQPVQRVLMQGPTPQAQAELLSIVETLGPEQRSLILRLLPGAWRQALGGN